jgi:hypothetical protein
VKRDERDEKTSMAAKNEKFKNFALFALFLLFGHADRNTYKWDTFTRTDIINFFSLISLCFVR